MAHVDIHRLKTTSEYFEDIKKGNKTFDVRKADRDFKVGDILCLREYDPKKDTYSGENIYFKIGYVLSDNKYAKKGYAILGLKVLKPTQLEAVRALDRLRTIEEMLDNDIWIGERKDEAKNKVS